MQKIARCFIYFCFVSLIFVGEYFIFVKGPQYAKPQYGTAISTYESKGRSSCWLATINFDNGDIQEVNTGSYEYKIGQRFVGHLDWNPILGACGMAYSWSPPDWLVFIELPAMVFNILIILLLISVLFVFAFSGNNLFVLFYNYIKDEHTS